MGTQSHEWTCLPHHLTKDFALYTRPEVLHNKKVRVDHKRCIGTATPHGAGELDQYPATRTPTALSVLKRVLYTGVGHVSKLHLDTCDRQTELSAHNDDERDGIKRRRNQQSGSVA